MTRLLLLFLTAITLSACSEVQFASHLFKNSGGSGNTGDYYAPVSPTAQQGTFKIGKPYSVMGTTYYPKESYDLVETGIASWYGPGFHGERTASGERFDTNELTAAHRTLQMPSLVRVTNLENGRSVVVRVNDRGPFARSRVIDVSSRAADLLDFKSRGTARVRLEVLPQESLRIAELAKRGQSTRGLEIAANNGRFNVPTGGPAIQVASLDATQPIGTPVQPGAVQPLSSPVPVHQSSDGRIMPDPVVTQLPVHPTSLYIQAGAFGVQDNAEKLRRKLSSIGPTQVQPTTVNGKQLYRVRVGPLQNVQIADQKLTQIIKLGQNKAMIVVD